MRVMQGNGILWQCWIVFFLILHCKDLFVRAGCRMQEDKCGPVCKLNPITEELECNLRAVLIFTNSTLFEASLPKMQVVWDLSIQKISEMKLLPEQLNFDAKFYDDRCDQSHAMIAVMDSYIKDCADVIFGPVCDYALATVARIAKYLKPEGTPVLTPGGNSYEYLAPKRTCEDEFHMLTRTGFLNYQPLANFTAKLFKQYNWKKTLYFYDRDGQFSIGGPKTCHLTMSALAHEHKKNNISYSAYSANEFENLTNILKNEISYDKTSEFSISILITTVLSIAVLRM